MIDKTELEVTQADREAAASILWVKTLIDDEEAIALAFARHRLATRTPDPTPVAWMYSCKRDVHLALARNPSAYASDIWTETPLYAHPPAVPADGLVEALEWYADQMCEGLCEGKDPKACAAIGADNCAGCPAVVALTAHRGVA